MPNSLFLAVATASDVDELDSLASGDGTLIDDVNNPDYPISYGFQVSILIALGILIGCLLMGTRR